MQIGLTMCVRSDKRTSDKEPQRTYSGTGFAKTSKIGVRAWCYIINV